MEWTSDAVDQLRALWAEGHSTAEIGRRMGISKNAVVGKAHRLNLPARPSPIRRDAAAEPRPVAAPNSVAAPRPATAPRAPTPLRRLAPPGQPATPQATAPRPEAAPPPAAAPAAVVRPFPRAGLRSCCWPLGEPGTPEFRFCEAEALAGKPYCPDHAAVAYVRLRDRREDAA
ncbi:GcrA family cell cycle regulator [Crenalkalicoccus roseus]|uniref:GcrA family cell cycle regulator n=1 Tax=Crenalkalicoccus roseus TaxID=1485588 RepID=UPI0010821A49|nr:GcrA family cell cycle regulator [Crenalkalicoccus roseus]